MHLRHQGGGAHTGTDDRKKCALLHSHRFRMSVQRAATDFSRPLSPLDDGRLEENQSDYIFKTISPKISVDLSLSWWKRDGELRVNRKGTEQDLVTDPPGEAGMLSGSPHVQAAGPHPHVQAGGGLQGSANTASRSNKQLH